jgi:hypothetical protein
LNTDFGIENEGKDCKIVPIREWVFMGGGRIEGIKESECGQCTLLTYMK